MSGKWKVMNNHPDGLTHKEKFRDEMIEIPAGKFVLMDYEDAIYFKGQMIPMIMEATGVQDRKSFKCITIAPYDPNEKIVVPKKYISARDGKEFGSQSELNEYLKQFSDEVHTDEVLEQEIVKKRGRPPKVS